MLEITLSKAAKRFLRKIETLTARRVVEKIEALAAEPFPPDVKGFPGAKTRYFGYGLANIESSIWFIMIKMKY